LKAAFTKRLAVIEKRPNANRRMTFSIGTSLERVVDLFLLRRC
jgi:hypothetical protein